MLDLDMWQSIVRRMDRHGGLSALPSPRPLLADEHLLVQSTVQLDWAQPMISEWTAAAAAAAAATATTLTMRVWQVQHPLVPSIQLVLYCGQRRADALSDDMPAKVLYAMACMATYLHEHCGQLQSGAVAVRVVFLRIVKPRQLPAGCQPVGVQHVNGGAAFPCSPGKPILVFREAEAAKVAIHEMVHAYCQDVRVPLHMEQTMARLYGVRHLAPSRGGGIGLAEAYTEALAEHVWSAILAGGQPAVYRKLWAAQHPHMRRTSAALLGHAARCGGWEEQTPVFAYYIVRCALLCHWPTVMAGPQASVAQWPDWTADYMAQLGRQAKGVRDGRLDMTIDDWW
jgi:hypothetical protein